MGWLIRLQEIREKEIHDKTHGFSDEIGGSHHVPASLMFVAQKAVFFSHLFLL